MRLFLDDYREALLAELICRLSWFNEQGICGENALCYQLQERHSLDAKIYTFVIGENCQLLLAVNALENPIWKPHVNPDPAINSSEVCAGCWLKPFVFLQQRFHLLRINMIADNHEVFTGCEAAVMYNIVAKIAEILEDVYLG